MVTVPCSFRDMPRWWHGNQAAWLDALPGLARAQAAAWGLVLEEPVRHGSNALVIPARRDGQLLVLRLTPPGPDFAAEVAALRFWNGRGTVHLLDVDLPTGAMLLERLGPDRSAQHLPLSEAVAVLAQMMRRLAVPPPRQAVTTAGLVQHRSGELENDWTRLGRPIPASVLSAAMISAKVLSRPGTDLAVNGDLHFRQVLRGADNQWTCVDPRLLRGDIEYDLARVLWSRLDEMSDDADIGHHLQAAVDCAGLDPDRARHWVLFRTVDYWLWGLANGLTHDPARCARLAAAITP